MLNETFFPTLIITKDFIYKLYVLLTLCMFVIQYDSYCMISSSDIFLLKRCQNYYILFIEDVIINTKYICLYNSPERHPRVDLILAARR